MQRFQWAKRHNNWNGEEFSKALSSDDLAWHWSGIFQQKGWLQVMTFKISTNHVHRMALHCCCPRGNRSQFAQTYPAQRFKNATEEDTGTLSRLQMVWQRWGIPADNFRRNSGIYKYLEAAQKVFSLFLMARYYKKKIIKKSWKSFINQNKVLLKNLPKVDFFFHGSYGNHCEWTTCYFYCSCTVHVSGNWNANCFSKLTDNDSKYFLIQ
jgi:hypothetical protein